MVHDGYAVCTSLSYGAVMELFVHLSGSLEQQKGAVPHMKFNGRGA